MSDSLGAASTEKQVLADRYELRELIGQGGMAEVHRAHDRLLDRTVAVKIFRQRDDPAAQRRFDDEGRALARLAHPGLVAIFDVGTVDDRRFLVMEFVEGTSVQSRLLAGPLPLGQVLRIGGVLADALAHAHLRGVVHRDVKPSNIMLDGEDLPHLTDFGIALLAGSPRLTSVHEVLGTPAYLAPEQLLDTEVGPAADVYALGLVLLECLSGEPEYASGNCTEVALSRLNRPPRIPAGLPPALIDLLTAMTATEPLDRPAAETCASRLVAALEDIGTDVVPERPVSMSPVVGAPVVRGADQDRATDVSIGPATAARSRPRWRPVAAAVAGITVVVAALVFLLDAPQPLTARPQTADAGRIPSGSSAGVSTNQARAARDAGTRGAGAPDFGTTGSPSATRMLVANEHSAPATAPTSPPPSSTPRKLHSAPGTTSSAPPPRPTTVSTQPPTTASSEQPTTMPTSTEPPSNSGAPGGGPGENSNP
jgi:serine/threonine protein kinase